MAIRSPNLPWLRRLVLALTAEISVYLLTIKQLVLRTILHRLPNTDSISPRQ
jgi:hypothetical protein